MYGNELLLMHEEPMIYKEATGNNAWEKAMQDELDSIDKNKTWTMTNLPARHKLISIKHVLKLKKYAKGEVTKYKARLVTKGYLQRHGIDYEEEFTPVARIETVRLLLTLATHEGWAFHHLDVKIAFLHGELNE
ncbi:putative mitochondrial protein AtMg00820 [Bidens hawaiensis]|uniref:putative mitochondrial protein AtMg00820 n=1 Tax=Bidens hawaiensis TaxID=980011 RepID=UPI00404AE2EA